MVFQKSVWWNLPYINIPIHDFLWKLRCNLYVNPVFSMVSVLVRISYAYFYEFRRKWCFINQGHSILKGFQSIVVVGWILKRFSDNFFHDAKKCPETLKITRIVQWDIWLQDEVLRCFKIRFIIRFKNQGTRILLIFAKKCFIIRFIITVS